MNDNQWEKIIADSLGAAGKKIIPPRELLSSIIARQGKADRAGSFSTAGKKSWREFSGLVFRRGFFVPIGVIAILLVVFFSLPVNSNKNHQIASVKPMVNQVAPVDQSAVVAVQDINQQPPTTEDVEAAATAILASVSEEDSTLANDVNDESITDADSAAIDNLMQTYDQDQF